MKAGATVDCDSGVRELFIYYRCPVAHSERVRTAVRRWQSGLSARHPALRCRLLKRPDSRDDMETWMETYVADDRTVEAGSSLASELAAGPPALVACTFGQRHVEVFVACAW